ncbi:hypothetical protein SAMN04487901_11483 [Prevotella communis]|uniref:Uncharacterized protein n=1 Tax=Prevotella communis TaxID=2913614 RepID=A0A1G7YV54_9BACT|nr:hypothetical protein SAMN04487901_11483 [Prevotella communis]
MDKKKRALFSYDAGDWYLSPLNNIYESFMYIYGHSCSVADKKIHE